MAPINSSLLERLENKLGIGRRRLNERILARANSELVERDTAALMLAAEVGIPLDRYSTLEQRAEMRSNQTRPVKAGDSPLSPILPPTKNGRTGATKVKVTDLNSVFVVHGRDVALRKALFEFLRAIGLKPLEWEKALLQAKDVNPHIDDVLDTSMGRVQAVIVLFSPDDDAILHATLQGKDEPLSERKLQGQPRPNVLFEAGMALARHPKKTLILQVGKVRGFSDIAGRHVIRLDNSKEKRNDVINRLEKIGCKVDRVGTDWMSTGDFKAARDRRA